MLPQNIIILLSVLALAYAEDDKKTEESIIKVISEMQSDGDQETDFLAMAVAPSGELNTTFLAGLVDMDTKTATTNVDKSSSIDEEEMQKAKKEVIEWAQKLDCDVSDLGPFKCSVIKQLVKKVLKHGDAINKETICKLSPRIKNLIRHLEESKSPTDEGLKKLIEKFKTFC